MKKILTFFLICLIAFTLFAEKSNYSVGFSFDSIGNIVGNGSKVFNIYDYDNSENKVTVVDKTLKDYGINLLVQYKKSEDVNLYAKAGLDYVSLNLLKLNGFKIVFGKGLPLYLGLGFDKYIKSFDFFDLPLDLRGGLDLSYYDWMPGGSTLNDNAGQFATLSAFVSANYKFDFEGRDFNAFVKALVGYRKFFGEGKDYAFENKKYNCNFSVGLTCNL